jgi:Na+/proline symporter
VGLLVAALVARGHLSAAALADPENSFGAACRLLLGPGTLGLMIASILAANMSTCSAFLVDAGALFTEGLYRRHVAPGRPDRHYLWVGRISGLATTLLGVLYAVYLIQSVLYTFLLTETLATFIGISVLGGIMWPRANRWGAIASLLGSLATNFILYAWTGKRLDAWDPNVFLAALLVGTLALVVVSLLTPPEPAAAIGSFFQRLRTSSDDEREDPLLLVNALSPTRAAGGKGWRAYAEDLRGFALGWIIVAALVASAVVLLRL